MKNLCQELAGETDRQEVIRLRTDVNAVRQRCTDLAERYNANASKLNKGLFRSWNLPAALDPDAGL